MRHERVVVSALRGDAAMAVQASVPCAVAVADHTSWHHATIRQALTACRCPSSFVGRLRVGAEFASFSAPTARVHLSAPATILKPRRGECPTVRGECCIFTGGRRRQGTNEQEWRTGDGNSPAVAPWPWPVGNSPNRTGHPGIGMGQAGLIVLD